eukprot:TRINITY_DN58730_c0_g1_i1.p1 TRINITY_DN58730_c0_g1~~TRINITY_DN58730_c0_g1_i1.p1  ORF type:complete len:356 (+),score=39.93 TRINITY_DN58730_c0_g1_i1:30-1097(+)
MFTQRLQSARQYAIMYGVFLLIGIGTLFQFYVLINAVDYWQARYPTRKVEFFVTMVHTTMLLVVSALHVPYGRMLDVRHRVWITYFMFSFVLILFPLVELLNPLTKNTQGADNSLLSNTKQKRNSSYYFSLLLVAVEGAATAIQQSSMTGLAATLTPDYIQPYYLGETFGGIFSGLLRLATKSAWGKNNTPEQYLTKMRGSVSLYFLLAILLLVCCMGAFFWLARQQEIKDIAKNNIIIDMNTANPTTTTINTNNYQQQHEEEEEEVNEELRQQEDHQPEASCARYAFFFPYVVIVVAVEQSAERQCKLAKAACCCHCIVVVFMVVAVLQRQQQQFFFIIFFSMVIIIVLATPQQ